MPANHPASYDAALGPRHFITCSKCGKRAYLSRSTAKLAARQLSDKTLSVYRCHDITKEEVGLIRHVWHFGHRSPAERRAP